MGQVSHCNLSLLYHCNLSADFPFFKEPFVNRHLSLKQYLKQLKALIICIIDKSILNVFKYTAKA